MIRLDALRNNIHSAFPILRYTDKITSPIPLRNPSKVPKDILPPLSIRRFITCSGYDFQNDREQRIEMKKENGIFPKIKLCFEMIFRD